MLGQDPIPTDHPLIELPRQRLRQPILHRRGPDRPTRIPHILDAGGIISEHDELHVSVH